MKERYTITAALPYANGALHLGHLAGAYLPADIFARFMRMKGHEVLFVCGSDEHGAAITMRAKKEGVSPQEIIDKFHNINQATFDKLGISFDYYHRTSAALHHETAQDFFKNLYNKGTEFEVIDSEQYYDEQYQQFLADRYIMGTCPKTDCGHNEAYGDQCEKCGSALSPSELIDPVSMLSGQKPVLKPTKHWYFKLDKHSSWLKEWLLEGKLDGNVLHDVNHWKKHVIGQCSSWIEGGLHPRAITRDLEWGIKVPLEDAEGKVLYVWFDAPIGYISATKQWALEQQKDWETFWKSPDTKLIHFIGKDNIVFHCIVFPAMLRAHGEYILPYNVPANQFLNLEGKKFSKSKGWVIEQHQYLEDFNTFPNKEDALRYALIRTLPENKDGDFKWDEFEALHDNELVANLGNFVNRVMNLHQKYYGGLVSAIDDDCMIMSVQEGLQCSIKDCKQKLIALLHSMEKHIEHYEFKHAIGVLMEISSFGNTILQRNEPWKIWKKEPDSVMVSSIMNLSVQITAALAHACAPFLPFTGEKLKGMLNMHKVDLDWEKLLLEDRPYLEQGHQLGEIELLFSKINDKKDDSRKRLIEVQKQKLMELVEKDNDKIEAFKEDCSFDDFQKVDLRVVEIKAAEKIPKANKLLKLTVDTGSEQKVVVSGIAKHYKADEIIGKKVLMIVNLKPRKVMGILSNGMILMTEDKEGRLVFMQPEVNVPNGAMIQ